ncbi:hypothetical protein E1A91_A11G337100v1 [Gossypium mustelinum]|uniref:SHSP domain-containing protein n=1 Tax=Gossypium mustelinum TaxID=34275 RepID=A0A5D2XE41_GOSMU|nr:hypothetical protein E1A91_A11G337100v1 [Gossypium mustelinum]
MSGDSPMASPLRSKNENGENNEHTSPQQLVLDVAPLNCVPYVGPTNPNDKSVSPEENTDDTETIGPAMIFLPSETTSEDLDSIVACTKHGVALTGAAATGTMGPIIGLVDIGVLEDSYYFRVSLPGVSPDKKDFSCDIESDGKVLIKGLTTTGEKLVVKNSQVFHMLTQNLCPSGHFTVSFELPGPVDPEKVTSCLANGLLEAVVKKR